MVNKIMKPDEIFTSNFKIRHLVPLLSFSGLFLYRHPFTPAPHRTDRGGPTLLLAAGL